MSLLLNPYKQSLLQGDLKHLTYDVSVEDYQEVFMRHPRIKGLHDAIGAILFKRLTLALHESRIPLPSTADDLSSIQQQLTTLVRNAPLPPIDG